jgi:hypothetical protein
LNIEVGTVFRWNNFPNPKYGKETKARWFIYIGSSGRFAQIAVLYLCTTTTQLEKFQAFGNRQGHSCFTFETNQFKMFDEDCVIDFDEKPYRVTPSKLTAHQKDISIKGKIDEQKLRMIYNRLLRSMPLSPKELNDIHDSLNMAGITGLKRAKHRKR